MTARARIVLAAGVALLAAVSACENSSETTSADAESIDAATVCTVTPPLGGACDVEGFACRFTTCTPECVNAGSGRCYLRAACSGGHWVGLDGIPCENPPAKCPTVEPLPGDHCFVGALGGPPACSYPDACADRPASTTGTETFSCVDGSWKLDTAKYVPLCPSTAPSATDFCYCGIHAYPTCVYPFACGSESLVATCDTATTYKWILTCGSPDAGPDVDAEVDADASAESAGADAADSE